MTEFIQTILRILLRDFYETNKEKIKRICFLLEVMFTILLSELFLAGGLTAVGFIPITPWGFIAMLMLNFPLGFALNRYFKKIKEDMGVL